MIKFIKKIDKDWAMTIGTLLFIWVLFNSAVIGFFLLTEGEYVGETNFFEAFKELLILELFFLTVIATVVTTIYLLFKKPINKLRDKT